MNCQGVGTKCLRSGLTCQSTKVDNFPRVTGMKQGQWSQAQSIYRAFWQQPLDNILTLIKKMFDNHILTLICKLYLGCFLKKLYPNQVDFMRLEILFCVINEETEAWKD